MPPTILFDEDLEILNVIYSNNVISEEDVCKILNISKFQFYFAKDKLLALDYIFYRKKDNQIEITIKGKDFVNNNLLHNIYNNNKTLFQNSIIKSLANYMIKILTFVHLYGNVTLAQIQKYALTFQTNDKFTRPRHVYNVVKQYIKYEIFGTYKLHTQRWSYNLTPDETIVLYIKPIGADLLKELEKQQKN